MAPLSQQTTDWISNLLLLLLLVGVIETYFLIRYRGKLKRGIPIWSRLLTYDERNFLDRVSEDIVEYYPRRRLSKYPSAFVRVQDGEALIYSAKKNWRTSWPYIGYVDLAQPDPKLEFRVALAMHLFLTPFLYIGFQFLPILLVIAIMLVVNFWMETKSINKYLQEQIEKRKGAQMS